jgi:hypothetical protein
MAQANDNRPEYWHPVDPTRHHRESGWDYRGRAIYHFTLAVERRFPLFGTLEEVLEPLPQSIGAVVRGFKSGCTIVYKEMCFGGGSEGGGENAAEVQAARMQDNGGQAAGGRAGQSTGKQVEAALVHFARIFAGRGSIWEQNPAYYHERILHAPGQLRRMIDYVKDNPRRLWLKKHEPDLFRLHRETEINGLRFTSLGNHFLLDWPDCQMVEMSLNATDWQIERRLQSALETAHNGSVTYTAAISNGEKLITRTLRERGYPLVVLLNGGFPQEGSPHERFYKPGGIYFEACSRGQLLLLEPNETTFLDPSIQTAVEAKLRSKAEARGYDYKPVPVTSQRYRFVALNEIAKKLSDLSGSKG